MVYKDTIMDLLVGANANVSMSLLPNTLGKIASKKGAKT